MAARETPGRPIRRRGRTVGGGLVLNIARPPGTRPPGTGRELALRWSLPLATLVFFVATAEGYGIFRDELYYLACGRHLDFGYVDHPPMIVLLATLARTLFGDSLVGLRSLPALAAAGTVLLVGDTARAMGSRAWGRLLAQALAATAPVYLSLFTIFSMNAFDLLIWAGLTRLAAHLLAGGDARLWLAFGALAGIGLETKLDVGLFGAGVAVGLVLARRADVLRSGWLWAGGALAGLLFLPHVLWQAAHAWPTRELVASAQSGKIAVLAPHRFVLSQLDTVGPVAALLAFAGLGWLLVARAARPFRPLGWAALVVLAVFAFSVAKPYYFAPAFTVLFPAAGTAVERWTAGRRGAGVMRALCLASVASILVAAPLAKPLLPVDDYVRYAAALGEEPGSSETHDLGRLPQFFADMHGWRELAEAVGRVHASLPPAERSRACVFTGNYGEAGAVDYFAAELDLPPAISGHNSYWLWGPGICTGEVLLVLGGERHELEERFAEVEAGGVFRCTDCMPYEDGLTIWIGRGSAVPLADAWPAIKHYD